MNTSRTNFSIIKRIPGRPSSSQMHSDCPPEREETSPSSPALISEQRSTSLSAIPTVAIQPRMAQLETLEAKMASIEVSLSNTPRRKKNGSITGSVTSSSIRSTSNKEVAVKELENLRNALKDKENIIQNLKGQLSATGLKLTGQIKTNGFRNVSIIKNHDHESLDVDKKHIEERLNRLRNETDNKRLIIKKLKMALERLDITDNIDVRIQQAELEYQVGREELNLLTLLEEARTLQICLEESNKKTLSPEHTFYSCLNALDGSRSTTLHAIDLTYDPKSPNFGAGPKEKDGLGLWIDWTLDNTGLRKGDRLIEVNGKVILTKTREDLFRLLSADPNSAKIVILRQGCYGSPSEIEKETGAAVKEISSLRSELEIVRERAEEAQRAKDGLRSDNIRLTHRISYLEEQVSELLTKITPQESDIRIITGNSNSSIKSQPVKSHHNITNINITAQSTSVAQANDLVFQKGPQVTALIQNINGNRRETGIQLPVRSKSSLSNVSNEQISVQKIQRHQQQQRHHHHHQKYRNSINNNSKLTSNNDYESIPINNNNNSVMEQSYKKATKIVQDLTKKDNNQIINKPNNNKHKPTCFESIPNSDILRHYNARKSTSVLDFRSSDSRSIETLENITLNAFAKRLYKKHDMRSVKSLDFDSDCTVNSSNQHVYDKPRPQPPKKPIRLSLHRAQSAQSMEGSIQGQEVSMRKPTKRNYKSEILAVNGSKDINQGWNTNKYVINKLDGGNGMCITAESASWC